MRKRYKPDKYEDNAYFWLLIFCYFAFFFLCWAG